MLLEALHNGEYIERVNRCALKEEKISIQYIADREGKQLNYCDNLKSFFGNRKQLHPCGDRTLRSVNRNRKQLRMYNVHIERENSRALTKIIIS